MCAEALSISRKNIYRQLKQPVKDRALKQQIEAVHRQHPAYGHRRIAIHLGINRKRAQRVMARYSLRPPRRQLKRCSTVSTLHHRYHNLLTARTITTPYQVWCSDLRRLEYRGTVWYLAAIEDMATRQSQAKRNGSATIVSWFYRPSTRLSRLGWCR